MWNKFNDITQKDSYMVHVQLVDGQEEDWDLWKRAQQSTDATPCICGYKSLSFQQNA